MKIRITGAEKRTYWYADKIGRIFETDGVIKDGVRYMLVDGTHGVQITDCEVVSEIAPTTLLPDESLSGVIREYREVKRTANVGERIKYVWPGQPARYNFAKSVRDKSVDLCDPYVNEDRDEVSGWTHDAYVVLEASDILRIDDADGVNRAYRMVEHKAAVPGERVIITKDGATSVSGRNRYYNCGDLAVVKREGDLGDIYADLTENSRYHMDGQWRVGSDHYAVLEPLTTAASAPLSSLPLADQYAENITVLTRKIAQLEGELRVAREDIVLIEEGVRDDIKALEERTLTFEKRILALETDSAPACVSVASGPVDNALPTFAKSAQQVRDEIVECAKADVSDLLSQRAYPVVTVEGLNRSMNSYAHYVDYVVNKEKRTVVAIVKHKDGGRVRVVGKSKCAPGETFNVHIGRAIALYRALGCEVPAEYLTCPQPETVRVGDVVQYGGGRVSIVADDHDDIDVATHTFLGTTVSCRGKIIDDSHAGVAEAGGIPAASSALKGAA